MFGCFCAHEQNYRCSLRSHEPHATSSLLCCRGGRTMPCAPGTLLWIIWNWDVFLSLLFIWSCACSDLLIKRFWRTHACCLPKIKSLPWRPSEMHRIGEDSSRDPGNLESWVWEETNYHVLVSIWGIPGLDFLLLGLKLRKASWVWSERPIHTLWLAAKPSLSLRAGGKAEDRGMQLLCEQTSARPLSSPSGCGIEKPS